MNDIIFKIPFEFEINRSFSFINIYFKNPYDTMHMYGASATLDLRRNGIICSRFEGIFKETIEKVYNIELNTYEDYLKIFKGQIEKDLGGSMAELYNMYLQDEENHYQSLIKRKEGRKNE